MTNGIKEFYNDDLANLVLQGFHYYILFTPQVVSQEEMNVGVYEILPVKQKQEADTICAFMGEDCLVRSTVHDQEYLALASSGALKERFYIPLY